MEMVSSKVVVGEVVVGLGWEAAHMIGGVEPSRRGGADAGEGWIPGTGMAVYWLARVAAAELLG